MIKSICHSLLYILLLFALVGQSYAQDEGLIINEFSNGPSTGPAADSLEYIELLVVGCPGRGVYPGNDPDIIGPDPTLVDIRRWIIDDNNGEFNSNPDTGGSISPGHIRFADHPTWASVPVGSIILIYNTVGFDSLGTGFPVLDDPQDAFFDNVYVLGIDARDSLGVPLLEFCPNFPSAAVDTYTGCTDPDYQATTPLSWQFIDLRNAGDGVQTRFPDGTFFHGVSYGVTGDPVDGGALNALAAGQRAVHIVDTDGTDRLFFFDNDNGTGLEFNNYRLEQGYSNAIVGPVANIFPGTPGASNNQRNEIFVLNLQNSTDAGPRQIVCGLGTTMQARGVNTIWTEGNMWTYDPFDSGIWEIVETPINSTAAPVFSSIQNNASTVSVDVPGSYIFRWTNNPVDGVCVDSDTVEIIFVDEPDAMAGPDLFVCGRDTTLQATESVFGGRWEFIVPRDTAGNPLLPDPIFSDINDPNSQITVTQDGSYRLRWVIGIPGCQDFDIVVVQFSQDEFNIDAGPDEVVCGFQDNFGGTGAGIWQVVGVPPGVLANEVGINDPANGRSPVTVPSAGTYTFEFVVGEGQVCENRDQVVFNFIEQPIANAGIDDTLCGLRYQLQGSVPPSSASGAWTQVSGPGTAIFADSTLNSSFVDVTAEGRYVFRWRVVGDDPTLLCDAEDDVAVNFIALPNADPGIDTTVCGLMGFLDANDTIPPNTVGRWKIVSGPDTININIADLNDPNTAITAPLEGVYTFRWILTRTVGTIICEDSSDINVGFAIPVQSIAGPDTLGLCDPFLQITGNEPTDTDGFWTQIAGPEQDVIEDVGSPSTMVTVNQPGVYEFVWTLFRRGVLDDELVCETFDTVRAEFIELPLAQAGEDQLDLCFPSSGGTGTLSASASAGPFGTGVWSQLSGLAGVVIADPSDPNTQVTVPDTGRYEFIWQIEPGTSCQVQDTVLLRFTDILSVDFEALPDTVCGLSTTLNTSGFDFGQWTASPSNGVVFTNQNDPVTEVFVPSEGAYTFTWTVGNDICQDVVTRSTVFVRPLENLPDPVLNLEVFLGKTLQLDVDTEVPGAVYRWSPDSTLSDPNIPNPVANPSVSQTYTVTISTGTDEAACNAVILVNVTVVTELDIPNVFTPNGDGVNDVWDVPLLSSFNNAEIKIFDRWGDEIFESVGYDTPWDGTNNGTPVPTSAYYYVIDFRNESDVSTAPEVKRGVINIVR